MEQIIEFKNGERTIFKKEIGDTITNYKTKFDIVLSDEELRLLNSMSFYKASEYLKTFNN